MLDYNGDVTKLKTFLNENGYELNSNEISVYHNPTSHYYKYPIVVIFHQNINIIIKDIVNNRKFQFESSTSDELIINFLKYLEKEFILV